MAHASSGLWAVNREANSIFGDTVNVASCFCDACKEFNTNLIISQDVGERTTIDNRTDTVPDYKIRGRKEKISLVKIYDA